MLSEIILLENLTQIQFHFKFHYTSPHFINEQNLKPRYVTKTGFLAYCYIPNMQKDLVLQLLKYAAINFTTGGVKYSQMSAIKVPLYCSIFLPLTSLNLMKYVK